MIHGKYFCLLDFSFLFKGKDKVLSPNLITAEGKNVECVAYFNS